MYRKSKIIKIVLFSFIILICIYCFSKILSLDSEVCTSSSIFSENTIKSDTTITALNIVENKEELEILKNELMVLLDQRNALDIKISSLLEQINTLEGSKNNNARK